MAPPRKSLLLARELAESPYGSLDQRFLKPFVLDRLCELASEKLTCGDQDALRLARLCCRIAQQLKTARSRTLGFARLASALRLAGRLHHAERAVAIALDAAPEDLVGDVLRRRAAVRVYQNRLAEAIKDARASLKKASGGEQAKSHEVLGIALFLSGDHQAGTREFEHCLAMTDPDAETEYCNALQNYATALAQGDDEQMEEALELCAKARSMLKRRHKMQRAKLWWTEGLLHLRLGHRKRAWRALDTARRSLIALQAAPEVAAIIADMTRITPKPSVVAHLCREAAGIISGRHPLSRPLGTLARAAQNWIPEAAAALRRDARNLASCPAL